jgi:hypothetical protein
MSLVWLELSELMKRRSGVALTQLSSKSSSNKLPLKHQTVDMSLQESNAVI